MSISSNEILPIDLVKLVEKINEEEFWNLKDIIIYIETEMETPYAELKIKNRKAFDILTFFTYLDGNSINLDLIERLLIKKKYNNQNEKKQQKTNLRKDLDYLKKISEIKKSNNGYQIHEQTQLKILKEMHNRKQKTNGNS